MKRFENKVVVITGGGSGLGRLCAKNWAAEGGKIVVTDWVEARAKKVAAEIVADGGTAVGVRADVRSDDDMAAAVQAAVDNYGRIDIMFANAGRAPQGFGAVPFEDTTVEEFRDLNAVVFDGVFYAGRNAARQMKKQGGGGNIVVTISAGAHFAYPKFGAYGAGKAGATGLVRHMAMDWGRYGIRVNALSPTHGMSVNFALPFEADALGMSYEEAALAEQQATDPNVKWNPYTMFPGPLKLNRPPSLQDNANVASFLASDDSSYMSGIIIISCDGGSSARTSIPFPDDWSLEDQA